MSPVPIVLQGQPHVPLDGLSAVVFALVFVVAGGAAWLRPAAGIGVMLALDPFAFYHYVGQTTITLPKTALLAVALGLLLRGTRLDAVRDRRTAPILAAAVAFCVVTALTSLGAAHHEEALRETLKAAEYCAALVVVMMAFVSDPDEALAFRGLLVGGVATLVLALAQEYIAAPAAVDLGGRLVPRIAGPLEGPNQLAGYLEIVLPTLLAFRLVRRANLVLDLVLIAGGFATILTFSRAGIGGLIAGAAVVAVAVAWPHRLRPLLVAWAVAVCAAIPAYGAAVISGRVQTAREGSDAFSGLGTRTDLWRAAWSLWRSHPLLGIGAGNYELEIGEVGPEGIRTHANSLYLQSLAEGGILLFAALAALFATVAIALTRYGRSPLALGALGATVALTGHQVFDDLFFFPKVGELWWMLVGVAAGTIAASEPLRRESLPGSSAG